MPSCHCLCSNVYLDGVASWAGRRGLGSQAAVQTEPERDRLAPFKRVRVADRSAIIIAILWASHAALVSVRGRTGAVGDGINRRAAAHQRMASGRSAVIGQLGE